MEEKRMAEKGLFKMIRLPAYFIDNATDQFSVTCSINDPVYGQSCVTGDYHAALQFLVESPRHIPPYIPRVVWSLSELVQAVKKVLPAGAITELESESHRTTWQEGETRYRLFYQPGKFFGIHAGRFGDEVTFYELNQFYPDDPQITNIVELKYEADKLSAAFQELGVCKIENLKSPVAVIEDSGLLDKVYESLPTPDGIPQGCLEYATLSDAWGAWCSAYQVGYWPEAYSYDLASCYPYLASKLLSLENAKYEYSKSIPENAAYGFLKGTLTINPDHPFAYCSPIVSPIGDTLGNPAGKVKGIFTLGQFRYIERNGMGKFEFGKRDKGWFIIPTSTVQPLKSVMEYYYNKRAGSPLLNMISKRIIAGIIGRLGQYIQDQPTKDTNPVYHSLIRNSASLLVGQYLIQNQITPAELINVNTDGFHTTRKIELPAKAPMGKWKCEGAGKLIVLSPDVIIEGDKCVPVLEDIRKNKKGSMLGDIDLFSMKAEQNRHFPKYPLTGAEVLKKHYQSEVIVL